MIAKTHAPRTGRRATRLGVRLLYGPMAAIVALGALAATFFATEHWTSERADATIERFGEALAAERLARRVGDGHSLLLRAAAIRGFGGDPSRAAALAAEGVEQISTATAAASAAGALDAEAHARAAAYRAAARQLASLVALDGGQAQLAAADADAKFDSLRSRLEMSVSAADIRARQARAESAEARRRATIATGAATLGGALVALLIALRLGHTLARPLERMVARVTLLADGDLDTPIPQTGRRDELGALAASLHVFRDTALELRRRAYRDNLTGLANRACFERSVADLEASGAPFTLLLIDLDKFKEVNDTLGHAAGDKLLVAMAERLVAALPEGWSAARLGGDEFAVLAPGVAAAADGLEVARGIIAAAGESFDLAGQAAHIGASIGLAAYPADAATKSTLLRHADLALYEAKAISRNVAVAFTPSLTAEIDRRRAIEARLRASLESGSVGAMFLPIVDMKTRRPVAVEALLRLDDDATAETLRAAELISVAEESGLIHRAGEAMLAIALDAVASWPERVRLHLNVSVQELKGAGYVDRVADALERRDIAPSRLTLELGDGVLAREDAKARAAMRRLRDLGVRFALDDFGAGVANLKALASLPFSDVKIDRSFVQGLDGRGEAEGLVRTVVELARSLDFGLIAEGVETEEQLRMLDYLGAERAQGFLFGRPMTPDAIGAFLREAAPATARRSA